MTDWPALLPAVARRLFGDPSRIGADEWRYGRRGSLVLHPARAAAKGRGAGKVAAVPAEDLDSV